MPKWRQWETTSEADWIALEYAAEAIEQASMRCRYRCARRFASALRFRTHKGAGNSTRPPSV
jgi:hypothetical protein